MFNVFQILFDKQRIIFSINGNLIDAKITTKSGDIFIDEGVDPVPASTWIIKRLANLPLLAARLIEQIPQEMNIISPAANLLPSLQLRPDGTEYRVENALQIMLETIDTKSPLETTVLYITSDAGEGKTWLINGASREQAERFNRGESDWLLVPIVLGGRHFLRFDDITVGALQNKYRFPFLYYNSFLALVRMGVIIPAFDGFEEMFVENSSGEALSAMGILVGALRSAGVVVVAARKAYFEFENLKSQEKLYDTISSHSVGFSKLELIRWEQKQFIDYCVGRGINNASTIYERVKSLLGGNHPLLTRPVLVRRLVDIAESSNSLDSFLQQIHASGADFFSVFVRGIIDREANEKWIDRSGVDVASSLLTADEHCELLSMIAVNMWESRINYLKRDHLDVVADIYCETKKKTSQQSYQIRERIRGHALLVASPDFNLAVEFDHDEFRQFFLGEGLAEIIKFSGRSTKSEVLSVLRKGILPEHSQLAFIRSILRNIEFDRKKTAELFVEVGKLDGQASYTRENCGSLVMRLINNFDTDEIVIDDLSFGVNTLRDCKLKNISFERCYFSPGSLERTKIDSCTFENCNFGQMQLYDTSILEGVIFENCMIDSLKLEAVGVEIWDPTLIRKHLEKMGASFGMPSDTADQNAASTDEMDEELASLEKILRYFMRSTHISESIIKIRLGDKGQNFIDDNLPALLESNVIMEIDNRGGGIQRRFKLGISLQKINHQLSTAKGSYIKFLENCRKG